MKLSHKAGALATLILTSFGVGGWVATAHERELQAQHQQRVASQPAPEVKTETRVVTREQTITTSVLSKDCQLLVDHTQDLYDSISKFNATKAEVQFILDTIGSAMVLNDKQHLNKAHVQLRDLDTKLRDVFVDIAKDQYSADLYQGRCKG